MDYELAKELKDAGFPQAGKGKWIGPPDALRWRSGNRVYVPTLSELIEACGDQFISLTKDVTGWFALGDPRNDYSRQETVGLTPEEAVARLWLALNKRS